MVKSRAPRANGLTMRWNDESQRTAHVMRGGESFGTISVHGKAPESYWEAFSPAGLFADGRFATPDDALAYIEVALGDSMDTEQIDAVADEDVSQDAPQESNGHDDEGFDALELAPKPKRQRRASGKTKTGPKEKTAAQLKREQLAAEKEADRAQREKDREEKAAAKKAAAEAKRNADISTLVSKKGVGKTRTATIAIDQIVNLDGGDPVTKEFVENVRVHGGLIQPPRLRKLENGQYAVIDGKRRIQALRELGHTEVDAVFETRSDADDDVQLLVANVNRSENLIAQHRAVKRLIDRGYTRKQISKATGMLESQVRKAERVGDLHPALMAAVEDGKMGGAAALNAVRMGPEVMDRLVATLDENGRITNDDVIQERRYRQHGAAAAVAKEAIANMPDVPDVDRGLSQADRYANAVAKAREIIALMAGIDNPDAQAATQFAQETINLLTTVA